MTASSCALWVVPLVLGACSACGGPFSKPEPGEWLPGGDTTNRLLLGNNAFVPPAEGLSADDEMAFFSGNAFFNQAWVEAPSSTTARDGLGPMFNSRTCSGCHFRDGKGAPPSNDRSPLGGLLLRLSVPGPDGPMPDPVYGGQLQDQANDDIPVEALARITHVPRTVTYADGSRVTLLEPEYELSELGYGPLAEGLMISARVAPHMVGLGLLEAIPVERLEALADPDDADADGISGRIQRHGDEVGRFGWKADAVDVPRQVAGAFAGDMGLTSPLVPNDDCTASQTACLAATHGGEPEVEQHIFDVTVTYSRTLAVPVRRNADDREVLKGKRLFHETGCAGCHVPSHVTGESAVAALEEQLVWPYTDLLLHDMGEGLADDRPVGEASGSEWRTAPLWGLGLVEDVSGHTRFLHDGRARSLEEAILWHGGEAEASRDAFLELSARQRDQLMTFLEDL